MNAEKPRFRTPEFDRTGYFVFRNTNDFVKQIFEGGTRENDVLMIRAKEE